MHIHFINGSLYNNNNNDNNQEKYKGIRKQKMERKQLN